MNQYRTKLFVAQDLEGKDAGEFTDFDGEKIDNWMELYVADGYTLLSIQPVAYDGSLYVLATMELVDLDTNDNA